MIGRLCQIQANSLLHVGGGAGMLPQGPQGLALPGHQQLAQQKQQQQEPLHMRSQVIIANM